MAKQLKQPRRATVVNQLAHRPVEQFITEPKTEEAAIPAAPSNLSQYMAAIGHKGGQIGGKRRLKTMTKEQRRKAAVKAARERWSKQKGR